MIKMGGLPGDIKKKSRELAASSTFVLVQFNDWPKK
jgi:hypothetical protein